MLSTESLPYDLVLRILELCQDHYAALANCALANKHLSGVAGRLLYETVVISPKRVEWIPSSGIPVGSVIEEF